MAHIFPEVEFIGEQVYVIVHCTKCGVKAKKYKYTRGPFPEYVYFDENDVRLRVAPPCTDLKKEITNISHVLNNAAATIKEIVAIKESVSLPVKERTLKAHKFIKEDIQSVEMSREGKFTYACACGLRMVKYKSGASAYYNFEGKLQSTTPYECNIEYVRGYVPKKKESKTFDGIVDKLTVEALVEAKRPVVTFIIEEAPLVIDEKLLQKYEEVNHIDEGLPTLNNNHWKPLPKDDKVNILAEKLCNNNILTNDEARLVEAYTVINLMHEDMVKAGLRTMGRNMAGRLLYSSGYQEKVKHLESK